VHSLTRGRISSLQVLLGFASAIFLGSKSSRTPPYFTVSYEIPPTWMARSPRLYSPRNRVAQLCPWALGYLFFASSVSQGYGGSILTRLHTCKIACKVKVKVILRPTDSRPVRPGVSHPVWTRGQFFPFSLWLFLDSCWFDDVGRPLWRDVWSVVFSLCRVSPAQPLSDLSPTGLTNIFYCLYF
jgi:hypothetical protein